MIKKRPPRQVRHDSADVAFLWEIHKYTNEYIRFADTKAAFLITIDSALIGTVISSGTLDKVFSKAVCLWSIQVWTAILALALCTISAMFAVWTVKPRLKSGPGKGIIFWESVHAYQDCDAYYRVHCNTNAIERSKQISDHIHALAKVANIKYALIKKSIFIGIPAGLLAGISVCMQHLRA